jgi:hypothetical protein
MLFHITMTHSADNCPAYRHEDMPDMIKGLEKMEEMAKKLSIKMHFVVWAAPEHSAFALLEADRLGSLAQFLNAIPIRQDFKVTPVENAQQMSQTASALMMQKK